MGKKSVMKALVLGLCATALAGCADDDDKGSGGGAPHTGNEEIEKEVSPDGNTAPFTSIPPGETQPANPEDGELRYVHATRLNIRSSTDTSATANNIVGALYANDKVLVMSEPMENNMVVIEVLDTDNIVEEVDAYYASLTYLSLEPQTRRVQTNDQFKYFMVQNIASEKLRIYEKRCGNGACAHHMVMETNVAVGEDKKSNRGLRTIAGNYHINEWIKFYQDFAGNYPSWYHPSLHMPPSPKKGVGTWNNRKYLRKGQKKGMRGAFGWYTAKPGPNASAQWTHGTIGWGSNKDKFIKKTKGWWANTLPFVDPRSHGCTRTDNESIAYIRNILPVKTPLIKIYAKEAYADPQLQDYKTATKTWDYILTKNGSRTDGELADRNTVLNNRTPRSEYLEEGTYVIDLKPTARVFKSGGGKSAKTGKKANVYGLKDHEMNGVFLVDAGTLIDYRHPAQIRVGGYKNELIPEYMKSKSNSYTMPTK